MRQLEIVKSLGILGDGREKKDDRNPELLSKNKDKKSLEVPDDPIIISNKEENTNILDLKLKK